MSEAEKRPATWLVALGFLTVYLVWGSTYLAIRVAVETLPPFLLAGARFALAGVILYVIVRSMGAAAPTRVQWRNTAIIGSLLVVGGNGIVTWAEQWVPSGLAALLVASMPLFFVLHGWSWGGERAPRPRTWAGIVLGFVGVAMLVGRLEGVTGPIAWIATGSIVVAALLWSGGSVLSRRVELPASALMSTGMQMLTGGIVALGVGVMTGEAANIEPSTWSMRSLLAWGYLVTFGSLLAFTAYVWILKVSTPARVSTYAYINPLVAVLLGWAILGEPLGLRTALAAIVLLSGVALITWPKRRSSDRAGHGVVHVPAEEPHAAPRKIPAGPR